MSNRRTDHARNRRIIDDWRGPVRRFRSALRLSVSSQCFDHLLHQHKNRSKSAPPSGSRIMKGIYFNGWSEDAACKLLSAFSFIPLTPGRFAAVQGTVAGGSARTE
ncbi:hypothetical protein NB311A_07788 [Nitrobacter sp. Nb-311A]|nr:hypothetical protein NB311A_07788 [Nitrobacter sp. Nb-311A]